MLLDGGTFKKKNKKEREKYSGTSFERHTCTHATIQFWGQVESEI